MYDSREVARAAMPAPFNNVAWTYEWNEQVARLAGKVALGIDHGSARSCLRMAREAAVRGLAAVEADAVTRGRAALLDIHRGRVALCDRALVLG